MFPPPFLSSDVCVSVWISMVATEKTSKPWEPSRYSCRALLFSKGRRVAVLPFAVWQRPASSGEIV